MKYYVNGKEYKTLKAAIAAAEKAGAEVLDENGAKVYPVDNKEDETDQGGQENAQEGQEGVQDDEGEGEDTDDDQDAENGVQDAQEGQEEFFGVPAAKVCGKIRRIFSGNIRIRNRPSWDLAVVRGATAFDEKEVTHLLQVDGKPMYRTNDGYFVTGDANLVEFIEG